MHPLESLDQHCWQLCVNTWLTGSTNKYSHRGRSRVGSGCREKPLICRKTTPPLPSPQKKPTSREQMQPSSPSTDSSWCLWMSAHARLLHIYHLHHLCNHHHYHHTLLSPFNLFLFVSAVSVLQRFFTFSLDKSGSNQMAHPLFFLFSFISLNLMSQTVH